MKEIEWQCDNEDVEKKTSWFSLQKDEYGNFCTGDSYILLRTYKKKKPEAAQGEADALAWDIHFWLGDTTTQDEAGTAAYKTVELDDILGGAAVQVGRAKATKGLSTKERK
jgi:hypothetical protein